MLLHYEPSETVAVPLTIFGMVSPGLGSLSRIRKGLGKMYLTSSLYDFLCLPLGCSSSTKYPKTHNE